MKKISNIVVAIVTLATSFLSFVSPVSAANKNVQVSSNVKTRFVFGDHIEGEEVIGEEIWSDEQNPSRSIDENKLVYVSVEADLLSGDKLTSIKINNEVQTIYYPIGRNIYTLPAASSYTVEATGVATVKYNINWSNPGYTDPATPEDVKIKNGAAKVVKVYDDATNMNDISATFACVAYGCVNNTTKEGHIEFEKGNVIVFEFVPQYGYQLTGVNMNGMPLSAQNDINQYVLDTANANGNGHFSATFTKTSDVVKTNTSAITSGVLDLSSGAIDAGTGRLSVDEFTPSADQVTKFADTAAGYEIADYIDLNMQQIFYKGANDDTNVWSRDLSQLAADANISLVLAEGVNGNDVAIVLEKHDGSCELISGTYDAASHTVSFATDGFSNYAIAYRTVNSPDSGAYTVEINGLNDSAIAAGIIILGSITAFYVVSRKHQKEQ